MAIGSNLRSMLERADLEDMVIVYLRENLQSFSLGETFRLRHIEYEDVVGFPEKSTVAKCLHVTPTRLSPLR